MGKAARNEQRKIRATWLNNVAVAFMVGGIVVPYFKFLEAVTATISGHDTFADVFRKLFTSPEYWKGIAVLSAFALVAAAFALMLRKAAHDELEKIED